MRSTDVSWWPAELLRALIPVLVRAAKGWETPLPSAPCAGWKGVFFADAVQGFPVSTRIAAAWGPRPRATAGGCACPFASSTDARGQGTPTIGACGTGGRRRSVCVRAHVGGGDMWGGSDAMAPHRLHL